MEKEELHLFIIWEKARHLEDKILEKIESNFEILQIYDITWSPYLVGSNFTRFYGQKLPKNSHKEKHCGSGEFKLILIRDNAPDYGDRIRYKENVFVNTKMFDLKSDFRVLTGGGHKIHGTDNLRETRHDLMLLLGITVDNFIKNYSGRVSDIKINRDLSGTSGWKNFQELFDALNECQEYVVLRNQRNLDEAYYMVNNGDVDILAMNKIETSYILGDLNGAEEESQHLEVDVNNKIVLFEVLQYGSIFCQKFESDIFSNKVRTNGVWHLSKEMEKIAYIYHVLLFNPEVKSKHIANLEENFHLSDGNLIRLEENLIRLMVDYFKKNDYKFTPPNDGYFNFRQEIKELIVRNSNRDSTALRIAKKIVDVKIKSNEMNIVVFKITNKIFFMKIKVSYLFLIKFLSLIKLHFTGK
jgi:hypothetical protein